MWPGGGGAPLIPALWEAEAVGSLNFQKPCLGEDSYVKRARPTIFKYKVLAKINAKLKLMFKSLHNYVTVVWVLFLESI